MAGHDSANHKIFGHPGMTAELLREFVPSPGSATSISMAWNV